ncbi:MAG TPA: hypothetical protein VMW42_05865 [Desulfatiglandales bacterium]|nr:hypothetical protein [Desulfatiglandales bacterium]
MIGRKNIKGEHGRLIGYELTIQRADQFRAEIPPTSPNPKMSPRDIIIDSWGPKFEMYTSRPNPTGIIYGTIWDITPEELELVREWEMVDLGCQEDARGIAVTDNGELVEVITQSFLKPAKIDRVIKGDDYEPYIWDKETMLKTADQVRLNYLKRKKKLSATKTS